MSDPGELPAFSRGAERLLSELVQRGLPAESVPVAARLVIALDERRLTVNADDDGADALLKALDQIEADR
ncbi:hypothetical protein [Conexibacter sp. S30A1]|uniref:hypothetical protein n=1 Tax=Conexibacter sp. S30A1 TaxID=2937800 RepID=UPI002010617D|nr:hypothetical protein [Conexibacter sp. S30A1]